MAHRWKHGGQFCFQHCSCIVFVWEKNHLDYFYQTLHLSAHPVYIPVVSKTAQLFSIPSCFRILNIPWSESKFYPQLEFAFANGYIAIGKFITVHAVNIPYTLSSSTNIGRSIVYNDGQYLKPIIFHFSKRKKNVRPALLHCTNIRVEQNASFAKTSHNI